MGPTLKQLHVVGGGGGGGGGRGGANCKQAGFLYTCFKQAVEFPQLLASIILTSLHSISSIINCAPPLQTSTQLPGTKCCPTQDHVRDKGSPLVTYLTFQGSS